MSVLLLEAVFCSRALARSSTSPRAFSEALDVEVRRSPAALEACVAPSLIWLPPSLMSVTPLCTSFAMFIRSLMLSALPSLDSAVPTSMIPLTTCVAPSMIDLMPSIRSMMAL